jgi:hypothetical protein
MPGEETAEYVPGANRWHTSSLTFLVLWIFTAAGRRGGLGW